MDIGVKPVAANLLHGFIRVNYVLIRFILVKYI